MALTKETLEALKREFEPQQTGVTVSSVAKDKKRAMLTLYVSHTTVAARLEEIDPSWCFEILETTRSGEKCCVRARLQIQGVSRDNCGEGEDFKGACSDALKRCAMLFGVGRYFYESKGVWVPYNEATDKFRKWTYQDYLAGIGEKLAPKVQPRPAVDCGSVQRLPAPRAKVPGRVFPDQPAPTDGAPFVTGYRIPFGKFKCRSLHEIHLDQLRSYVDYLERSGKDLSPMAADFIARAEKHIGDFENGFCDGPAEVA